MNETKKPLEFEEWRKFIDQSNSYEEDFQAARQGTIPADRAVEIPEVGEWPERNDDKTRVCGVGVVYTLCENEEDFKEMWGTCAIRFIPRPQPIWAPHVGEAVFVHYNPTQVGKIEKVKEGNAPFVVLINGESNDIHTLNMLKPFSESAIGKEWSQI